MTEDGREGSAAALNTTNNRMELRAVLELLRAVPDEPLLIQVDSAYVIGIFSGWLEGWRKRGMRTSRNEPVENVDLIEAVAELLEGRDAQFEKVAGHSGHPLNERADLLALASARRAELRLAGAPRDQWER